jgi:hypothetical protein
MSQWKIAKNILKHELYLLTLDFTSIDMPGSRICRTNAIFINNGTAGNDCHYFVIFISI